MGGVGSDTYSWRLGDGADTISDGAAAAAAADTDVLQLADVDPNAVSLRRVSNSTDLIVRVSLGNGEFSNILVTGQFGNAAPYPSAGVGLEIIRFADGSEWTLADIVANAAYFGSLENDTIIGGAHDERFFGREGNDSLIGNAGNDHFDGGIGADTFSGGLGMDVADYSTFASAVALNLAIVGAQSTSDVLIDIEGVRGSALADSIEGNIESNWLSGGSGNDTLRGQDGFDQLLGDAGDDALYGGIGTDEIFGGDGNDSLYGEDGNDSVHGGVGDDILSGGLGADYLNGAGGVDRVQYLTASDGVLANLYDFSLNRGEASGDVYLSIENLQGSNFNDDLRGDDDGNFIWGVDGADKLYGRSGADNLFGGEGNDTIFGGSGDDSLNGGGGVDVFVFDTAVWASNVDRIIDYVVADDLIQLDRSVFAAFTTPGVLASSAFRLGSVATTASHRILYDSATGQLLYDADGNGAGSASLVAILSTGLAMTSAEFLVI